MITIVTFKSNKAVDSSRQHTIKYSLTLSSKTKSIIELYLQTKTILKLMSNVKKEGDLATLRLKLQITPSQESSGTYRLFFSTQGSYIGNSPIKTSLCQSPNKALGFGIILMMMTKTISLEDQMDNLKKLTEGLLTSLKEKDHEIRKLINKLKKRAKPCLPKLSLNY